MKVKCEYCGKEQHHTVLYRGHTVCLACAHHFLMNDSPYCLDIWDEVEL